MRPPVVLFIAMLLAVGIAASPAFPASPEVTVKTCLVSLIEEARVPAQEAGVLLDVSTIERVTGPDGQPAEVYVPVTKGRHVTAGQVLAQIDNTYAKLQQTVAEKRRDAAQKTAENTTSVDYANAAAQVAWAEYTQAQEANRISPGTFPESELRRLKLEYTAAFLQVKKATMDQELAAMDAEVSAAELESAKENLARRQIRAPIGGIVVDVLRHPGEWVQAGEPVMHIVGLDRLRVEGFLKFEEHAPGNLEGCRVTVTVKVPVGHTSEGHGQENTRDYSDPNGRVVFVSPLLQADSSYRIEAEVVKDPNLAGRWSLQPGMTATMTIHLDEKQPAAAHR